MTAFYLDEDMAIGLTPLLAGHGHTAMHTHSEGMDRARDYQQLLYATGRGWILVTHNLRDFRLLHGAWHAWAAEWGVTRRHSGILVVRQLPPPRHGEIAHAIDTFIRRPAVVVENALYEWTPQANWQAFAG